MKLNILEWILVFMKSEAGKLSFWRMWSLRDSPRLSGAVLLTSVDLDKEWRPRESGWPGGRWRWPGPGCRYKASRPYQTGGRSRPPANYKFTSDDKDLYLPQWGSCCCFPWQRSHPLQQGGSPTDRTCRRWRWYAHWWREHKDRTQPDLADPPTSHWSLTQTPRQNVLLGFPESSKLS